jgi:hypothetical protein
MQYQGQDTFKVYVDSDAYHAESGLHFITVAAFGNLLHFSWNSSAKVVSPGLLLKGDVTGLKKLYLQSAS